MLSPALPQQRRSKYSPTREVHLGGVRTQRLQNQFVSQAALPDIHMSFGFYSLAISLQKLPFREAPSASIAVSLFCFRLPRLLPRRFFG